eukprot:2512359-Pleurochrysis_carterae.AAC.1
MRVEIVGGTARTRRVRALVPVRSPTSRTLAGKRAPHPPKHTLRCLCLLPQLARLFMVEL